MLNKYFFLFFTVVGLTLYSQNLSIHKISDINIVTISNPMGIAAQIPQSLPGSINPDKQTLQPEHDNPLFTWVLKFSAAGRVFKDISFYNTQVGYIVSELGGVFKTTDGGDNWTAIMNLGFPYYWYGVNAISADTVVISGFNNQGPINTGVVRWTLNGGTNWSADIVLTRPLSGVGWLDRVHFFNQNTGIVMNGLSGDCYYTSTGGKDSSAWTFITVYPSSGWIAGNIDAQANGNVYATGIRFAKSTNYGLNWTTSSSADNVFDGGVDFLDNNNLFGWTGGGQISDPVSGWTHRTTDGGTTWGPRQLVFPYPVRAVYFFDQNTGFAIGGNLYQNAGGIYSTSNGGANWNLDNSTGAEMFSMDYKAISPDSMDVWCVGSTGGGTGYTGKLYKARIQNLVGINLINSEVPKEFKLYQNYPNPFNPLTKIKFQVPAGAQYIEPVQLIIYDILGNEIQTLVNKNLQPGTYEITFDGKNLSSGVYFYRLNLEKYSEIRKMILVK
ncbi:MAG TPA: T9SS type A sorting domain-containing protein [Ignavibacteria bacterium]|jgi:hypothetical protein